LAKSWKKVGGKKNPEFFPRLCPRLFPRLFPRLWLTIQLYLPRLSTETDIFQDFLPDTIFLFQNRFLFLNMSFSKKKRFKKKRFLGKALEKSLGKKSWKKNLAKRKEILSLSQ
jgi:hypothetical protein